MAALRKAGGNWVEGDRFFDREAEIEALAERVRDGVHTLLTAQRRMGKTSLVRELLRRLKEGGSFETIFVDLEGASTPADAIAEIGFQSEGAQGVWKWIQSLFANVLPAEVEVGGQVPALAGADLRVKLRAGVDGYRVALEMLTEAANNRGRLPGDAVRRYGESLADETRVRREVRRGLDREVRQRESLTGETPADPPLVEDVLHVLEHDGYLARQGDGYRFVSGLLEDWWRVRYGRSGAPSASSGAGPARSARR